MAAKFTFAIKLTPSQREQSVQALQQTLDQNFDGPSQRGWQANFFNCLPPEVAVSAADCYSQEPAAVALRALVTQLKDGAEVLTVTGVTEKWDQIRLSMLLDWAALVVQHGAASPSAQAVAEQLSQLHAAWERACKLTTLQPAERNEWLGYPARLREEAQWKREMARLRQRPKREPLDGVLEAMQPGEAENDRAFQQIGWRG